MTSLIEATNVRRTYGSGAKTYEAVRGVDLSLARGELLAVLGVNGAGKTSLVEVLEGMAPATGGSIKVFGHDPHTERGKVRPRTGIMLQEAGFSGDLTIAETLQMWGGTLSSPRPIAEALEIVNLGHRADVRVKSLSGGERRRLDLAMATLGRPELLFLDEPTTGLDPASREATWAVVQGMLDHGTSVLLTTHYLEEAEQLADRLVIMAEGRIVREGTVAQITAEEPSRINFDAAALSQLPLDDVAALPALLRAPETVRNDVVLTSSDLQATLGALLGMADARGVRLENLDARSGSLEKAFLSLSSNPAPAVAA
ncbi:ABC transporter ATP-binding protein [Tessaracoccus terricola]